MTTISTRPSASWPTPVRGLRGASWLEVNASWARKTGPPLRTSTGPPPTAFVTPVHSGRKISRRVRNVPTGDSSSSRWPGGAARDEHRAALRDRRAAAGGDLDHRPDEVGVRRRRRERRDHDLGHARLDRRGRPVGAREERDAVRPRRLVEVVQRPPLAEPAPGAEELDPAHVERALGSDARAGAVAVGRALDDVVAHQDAARPAGVGVEVGVDADHRRARREPLLHRR